MISRTENASRWLSIVQALALLLVVCVLPALAGCKKKPKPFPPAPQLLSNANPEGVSRGSTDAGAIPVNVVTAAPKPPSPPADTMAPADRAAFEQTKAQLRELDAMVKRGVVTNPDKPDEGDATTRCGDVESARERLETLADPEAKLLVAESKRLCSLEVPILSADRTLKQVTISPSQASRQLMCKYASKDLDKAKKEKPTDRRVRDLDARFAKACR